MIAVGLVIGFAVVLGFEVVRGVKLAFDDLTGLVVVVLPTAFVFGLLFGLISAQSWAASLAFVQLALRWRSPVRLLRFLDDARERDVLRAVGPVYQFRHARLQDRLAGKANTGGPMPEDSAPTAPGL